MIWLYDAFMEAEDACTRWAWGLSRFLQKATGWNTYVLAWVALVSSRVVACLFTYREGAWVAGLDMGSVVASFFWTPHALALIMAARRADAARGISPLPPWLGSNIQGTRVLMFWFSGMTLPIAVAALPTPNGILGGVDWLASVPAIWLVFAFASAPNLPPAERRFAVFDRLFLTSRQAEAA